MVRQSFSGGCMQYLYQSESYLPTAQPFFPLVHSLFTLLLLLLLLPLFPPKMLVLPLAVMMVIND